MKTDYYDYDAWVRRQHDDENENCLCAECREIAELHAADIQFDMWYEDYRLGNL